MIVFFYLYIHFISHYLFLSQEFFIKNNTTKKALFFVSVGFAYKIISAILERILGNVNVGFSLLSDGGISWFMFALSAYVLILKVLERENKVFILILSLILSCFVGYDQTIGDFLYLSRIIIFFLFFLSGVLLKNFDFKKFRENNPKLLILAIAILVVWLSLCFFELDLFYRFRYLFTGRNPFFPQIMSYGPATRLSSYIISYSMGFSLIMLVPSNKLGQLTTLGKNSINVYFWHMHFY